LATPGVARGGFCLEVVFGFKPGLNPKTTFGLKSSGFSIRAKKWFLLII
jgi:hypothetical protein